MSKILNNYFPHDFNAMTDRKILRLRKVLGAEGYGIYWMLIEILSAQEDFSYPMDDIDLLSDQFGVSKEKIEAVVRQFQLFKIDKEVKFFSLSLIARMQKYLEKTEQARIAANKRWEKARETKQLESNADALHQHSGSNAIKEKERKEKEIIDKAIFESFRKKYPHKKRGLETEYKYFTDKIKDWKEVIDKLEPALDQQIKEKEILYARGEKFIPAWKHLKSWIFNRYWEMEIEEYQKVKPAIKVEAC